MTTPPGLPAKLEHFIGGAAADIDRAVHAARTALRAGPWPDLPARQRARILNKIADGIEAPGRTGSRTRSTPA